MVEARLERLMLGERLHMSHGKMFDSRMKVQRLVYVVQVLAAATVVLVVLVVEDAVTIAATAFIS